MSISSKTALAELRRRYKPEVIIPALFDVPGLVDLVTIDLALPKR